MAKILLHATCVTNPDNSFAKREVFYTTGLLQTGVTPISYALTTTISCSPFTLAAGTVLEQYCALAPDGTGVLRVITATGVEFTNFGQTDTPSSACDGTCDLNAPYVSATPTSSTTASDGTIRLDVTTSYPPITVYNPQLGSPTTQTLYSTPGSTPATYIVEYANVPAGPYAIQIQDNGQCQFTTQLVTVGRGAPFNTGNSGLPANIDWFKYEVLQERFNRPNNGGDDSRLRIQGYAWNKTTKQGYLVPAAILNYPTWYYLTPHYPVGSIVYLTDGTGQNRKGRYYIAIADMVLTYFQNTTAQGMPTPKNTSYWAEIPVLNRSKLWFDTPNTRTSTEYDYFTSPAPTGNINYYYYEEGAIVRFGWDGLFRAKYKVTSRTASGRIPEPVPGISTAEWEPFTGYDEFFYAIPETQPVDQYALGTLNRRVRYHTYDPTNPSYQPTSTSWLQVSGSGGDDFILFDDNTPTVETNLGDLKVIDLIKNDVDDAGAENGSVAVLAVSPAMPIRFHLRNGVRPGYVQDNQTGIYENLHAGLYTVDITDAEGRYTSVEFTITDNYRKRWQLLFDDSQGQPISIHVYQRNWAGNVTDVCGTGTPVILSWDSGGDPGGYLPEAVGANLEFQVYTSVAQQFVDTILSDDRAHRIDYYRGSNLQFRGYLDATQYQEKLLGPGQPVTLLATDGLGQLKSTQFINHHSERQQGRTSMLSILLKCLSFCDVNLPVLVGVNLRDRLMTADGDPLLEAFVQRNAYEKKDGKVIRDEDLIDCRTVINAILQVFNALLFQADGCWKIIALNEVQDPFAVRAYSPAGTLLPAFDTSSPPLRILEPQSADGPRELYWVNGGQVRTTVAAAQILKAVVPLQLETDLFRNGDFVLWDGNRPSYWALSGTPGITRVKGEKAKESAVQFAGYTTSFAPGSFLLSPPVPHLPGQDEDGMQLRMRAKLQGLTTNPAELKASVFFQVVCDGTPYGIPEEVVLSTKDGWKDYVFNLPLGLPGTSVRIRVLKPQASNLDAVSTTVAINSLAMSIQPGLRDWSDQKDDHIEVTNSVQTGIRLPDVELVHADLPQLPNAAGNPLPPKKMDVFAWRHAVSLADYTATTGWYRPANPLAYATLLENAAQDRMALRAVPASIVPGEVQGPGFEHLRIGMMLDMQDLDGRFLVISCFKNEKKRTAQIVCRRLADGDYGGLVPEIPTLVRSARKGTKAGYRVASVGTDQRYRSAEL